MSLTWCRAFWTRGAGGLANTGIGKWPCWKNSASPSLPPDYGDTAVPRHGASTWLRTGWLIIGCVHRNHLWGQTIDSLRATLWSRGALGSSDAHVLRWLSSHSNPLRHAATWVPQGSSTQQTHQVFMLVLPPLPHSVMYMPGRGAACRPQKGRHAFLMLPPSVSH